MNSSEQYIKQDGVGPVDNRPSTDKLHLFVKKHFFDFILFFFYKKMF